MMIRGTAIIDVNSCEVAAFWNDGRESTIELTDYDHVFTTAVLIKLQTGDKWIFSGKNCETYAQCFYNLLEDDEKFGILGGNYEKVASKMLEICTPYIMHQVNYLK